jgi:hypothetical protein
MTFDEWWNGEAAKGQWVGEYETDAESNARIGWEAALSHSSETTSGSGETPRTDARQLADATRHSSDALDNAYELSRQLESELREMDEENTRLLNQARETLLVGIRGTPEDLSRSLGNSGDKGSK